jgi:hypothetical protein
VFKIYVRKRNIDKIICIELRVHTLCKVTTFIPVRYSSKVMFNISSKNSSLKMATIDGRNM